MSTALQNTKGPNIQVVEHTDMSWLEDIVNNDTNLVAPTGPSDILEMKLPAKRFGDREVTFVFVCVIPGKWFFAGMKVVTPIEVGDQAPVTAMLEIVDPTGDTDG